MQGVVGGLRARRYWRRVVLAAVAIAALLCDVGGVDGRRTALAQSQPPALTQKLNAYVGCINRLSERSYSSRQRYFSWVGKKGPTGRERIIYGTYTIYDTTDCAKKVSAANALEPREPDLETAASAFVAAVTALEPLLKETSDYYEQENYKDDRMAKGKALHPRLIAAWNTFASADTALRQGVEAVQDRLAANRLVEIERTQGRLGLWHVEATMLAAKRVQRANGGAKGTLAALTKAIADYEASVKTLDELASADKSSGIDSSYVSSAKSYLVSAKQLMRRVRDKVPYSTGDKMMLNAGSGWMVEGSPGRLTRDYNQLVDTYNRGKR